MDTPCDAYKTVFWKIAVFPQTPPAHLINASLRHCSRSIALDLILSNHYTHLHLSFLLLLSARCWLGWIPDMDLLRCKWVQEWGSYWKERWVDSCVLRPVGTLAILHSLLASGTSHRPSQPVSDLTAHLQNTSIPKAETGGRRGRKIELFSILHPGESL